MNRILKQLLLMFTILGIIWIGFIGLRILKCVEDIGSVEAAIIIVDSGGNGNYSTIQKAIDNANTGDIIYVWNGIYYENVIVNKSITLIGNGSKTTSINGSGNKDVINITTDWVNITGFNISLSGNQVLPNPDAGIKLFNVQNVLIYDNNLSNHPFGIFLNNSHNNTIKENIIARKNMVGIFLQDSNNNIIEDNIVMLNSSTGISLHNSNSNSIINNKCNFNDDSGIGIYYSNSNFIINNNCDFNAYGLEMASSHSNTVIKNNCSNNIVGILIRLISNWDKPSSGNMIDNNNCSSNDYYGIALHQTTQNTIINNTCSNNKDGIVIRDSTSNNIINNTCNLNNNDGIFLEESDQNKFKHNNFSKNMDGILLYLDSEYNTFIENTILNNSNRGISMGSSSNNNLIYHNIISFNAIQASESGVNNWDYSGEGNYWSDYTGVDNGANGRWAGDGIGDTNIPHPESGFDNYPFIKPYGWLFPSKPVLLISNNIDPDGNYTISWYNDHRAVNYILEEDINYAFTSPKIYNTGWVLKNNFFVFDLRNRSENTYYYRLKAFNNHSQSDWSDILNITVNHLPNIPQNLQVSVIPEGNALHIFWDLNCKDTVQYGLYYMNISNWKTLKNITHPNNTFDHTGLNDGELYSYKICAIDSLNQSSGFSEIISAVPMDSIPPSAPTGLSANAISYNEIEISWDSNTEPDIAGYLLYMNDPANGLVDNFQVIQTISDQNTSYIVSGLTEQVTYQFKFKAFDEVPNNSSFSNVVSATPPDEMYPLAPTGLKISNATYNSLTVTWESNTEPDVIGYIVYRSLLLTGSYEPIFSVPINHTQYIDIALKEATIYYYKIKAIDDANLTSPFSNVTSGRTLLDPYPPEINNTITDLEILEDIYDDYSINLYYLFKDVNNDPLNFSCENQKNITITIYQENGTVILQPKLNWNGEETVTFYASDEVFNIYYNITITVTSVNDPPGAVKIVKPENGITITEDESLNFEGVCDDPDLSYGDELTFKWFSSIEGFIDEGNTLKGIRLTVGEHLITLEVSDNLGEESIATIDVTILEKAESNKSDDNIKLIVIGISIIIIVIILVVVLFMIIKKKKPVGKKRSINKINKIQEVIQKPITQIQQQEKLMENDDS